MAGPYDYTVNIPQPPAQNFLQSLTGIMQLRQMQEQSALQQQQAAIAQQNAAFEQQMQPLRLKQLQEQINASQAQQGLLGTQANIAKLNLEERRLVSSTLQNYLNDDTKTVKDIIPALPYLDATAVENIGKAEQIRVNREVDAALKEGKEITASDIRGWSNRQTLLKGPEQQQFQQSFLAMTPQFQSAAKSGMINAVNAAFAGNMEAARNSAAEVQQALINSKDTSPAAKAVSDSFGKIVDLIDQDPNIPKEILALNAVNAAGLVGDPRLAEDTLKIVKEFGDQTKPGAVGKSKEVDEEERAQKLKKGELDIEKEQLQIKELQQKLNTGLTEEVQIKDVFTKKLLKESTDKAKEYSEKANSALAVLDKIDSKQVALPTSVIGNLFQYVRDKVPMLANDITALRNDYKRIKNSEAIKNLPKGSASDKDVAFAKQGLMSENANPTQLRKAIEAMARLNSLDAAYYEAQASWISRNGNIGDTKKEISVLGDIVPKGTGFREWWKKSGSSLDSAQADAPVPAYTPPAGVTIKSVR